MKKQFFLNMATIIFLSWFITGCGGADAEIENDSATTPKSSEFITTWITTADDDSIVIPTTGGGYDYTVDWGDGATDTNQTGNTTHTYATADTYTVKISGDFPRIYFNNSGDIDKIKTIENWGEIAWSSMEKAFYGCWRLTINSTAGSPDLSAVADMSHMFRDAQSFNSSIDSWNTANVTSMRAMFLEATKFNQDLATNGDKWNVSKVTNMWGMFKDAEDFSNRDLSSWDVSSVTSRDQFDDGWGTGNTLPNW